MSPETPTSRPDAALQTEEHRWYYRTGGRRSGPVSTEQLLRDAGSGLLTGQTEVRLGPHGEWMWASTLDGLLPGAATSSDDIRAEGLHAASGERTELSRLVTECRVYLHERDAQRSHGSGSRDSRGRRVLVALAVRLFSRLAAAVGAAGNAAVGVTANMCGAITICLPRRSSFARIARSRRVWCAVAVGVPVAAGSVIYEAQTQQQRQAATVLQMASELRRLREATTDDAAWSEFAERVRRRLDEIVPELEEAAHAGDRASIDLLWAARDYLPKMLTDSRYECSDAERQFDVCMGRLGLR